MMMSLSKSLFYGSAGALVAITLLQGCLTMLNKDNPSAGLIRASVDEPPLPPGGGGGTNNTAAATNYVKCVYHYHYTSSQGGGSAQFFPANWKALSEHEFYRWAYLSINTNVWYYDEGPYDALCAVIMMDSEGPNDFNTNTFILGTFPSNGVYASVPDITFTWNSFWNDKPVVFDAPFYTSAFFGAESPVFPAPRIRPDVILVFE